MTTVIKPESFYSIQFQHYVIRNVVHVLGLVQQASPVLPDELQVQALHTLSYALQAPTAWAATRELFIALAPKMEQAGHREDWIPYLQEALHQSIRYADRAAAGECHLQLAILYRLLSQFDTAHKHLQAALDHFTASPTPRDQARTLNELAWLEHLQQRYDAARIHVQAALDLLPASDEEQGMSYRVQGMIAIGYRQWPEAESYHRLALERFEQYQDQRKVAWSLQNIAYILTQQQRYSEAFPLYEQAAHILKQREDRYHLGVVFYNLAFTQMMSGQPNHAVHYYTQAQEIFYKLNAKLQLAKLSTDSGLNYLTLKDYRQAEFAFLSSIKLYEELGDHRWRLNAIDGLAMAYLAQRKYTQALAWVEQALQDLTTQEALPNYSRLHQAFNAHRNEARAAQTE